MFPSFKKNYLLYLSSPCVIILCCYESGKGIHSFSICLHIKRNYIKEEASQPNIEHKIL